jgi:hypothetical protein
MFNNQNRQLNGRTRLNRFVRFYFFAAVVLIPVFVNGAKAAEKSWNIELAPLSVFSKRVLSEAEIAGPYGFSFGPTFGWAYGAAWIAGSANSVSTTELGLRITHYLNGVCFAEGWFAAMRATLGVGRASTQVMGSEFQASSPLGRMSGMAGYGWSWTSGFNMQLGAGISYLTIADTVVGHGVSGEQVAPLGLLDGFGSGADLFFHLTTGFAF